MHSDTHRLEVPPTLCPAPDGARRLGRVGGLGAALGQRPPARPLPACREPSARVPSRTWHPPPTSEVSQQGGLRTLPRTGVWPVRVRRSGHTRPQSLSVQSVQRRGREAPCGKTPPHPVALFTPRRGDHSSRQLRLNPAPHTGPLSLLHPPASQSCDEPRASFWGQTSPGQTLPKGLASPECQGEAETRPRGPLAAKCSVRGSRPPDGSRSREAVGAWASCSLTGGKGRWGAGSPRGGAGAGRGMPPALCSAPHELFFGAILLYHSKNRRRCRVRLPVLTSQRDTNPVA